MKNLKTLLTERGALVTATEAMIVAAGERELNAEELERESKASADLAKLDEQIAVAKRSAQRSADSAAAENAANGGKTPAANGGFATFGEFCQAVYRASSPGGALDPKLAAVAYQGIGEQVPSDAGFLVQKDISSEILRRTYEVGAISSRVRRIPISAGSNGLKINAIDESSRANGSRWGGVQVYWTAEGGTATGTKPKFRQIELNLKKLTGLVYATDEVLNDATALESIIMQALPEEINFVVEDAIVNGNGSGQPLGFLNSGAVITVAAEGGQGAATLLYENVVKMWARMWGRSRQNAVWLINQDIEPQLYSMALKIGTGGVPVYMPAGGLPNVPSSGYATLFGRPVIPVEYCQTLGTPGDIILADLSQYLTIDKGGIQQASSMHVRFVFDEMTFRFVYRVDGQPIWNTVLTPKNGTNTLSPFVVLATR